MSRFRKKESEEAEIDLTPMLDVVFIMLIFFIVTASFVKEKGIEITRPDQNNAPPPPPSDNEDKDILIQINANSEIFIDQRRIDLRAVRANIERMYAENPKASLIIEANNQAKANVYAAVADAGKASNVASVTLLTKE